MSTATLKIKRQPEGGIDYIVQCEHATTTYNVDGPERVDLLGSALAVAQHHAWERCRCTRKLRKKYPPALIELEAMRINLPQVSTVQDGGD